MKCAVPETSISNPSKLAQIARQTHHDEISSESESDGVSVSFPLESAHDPIKNHIPLTGFQSVAEFGSAANKKLRR